MDRTFGKRTAISTCCGSILVGLLLTPACGAYEPTQQPPSPPAHDDTVTMLDVAPPPISGGTLVMVDDQTAVAADADRDRVWIVDVAGRKVLHELRLPDGSEPGRVLKDAQGRAHVLL